MSEVTLPQSDLTVSALCLGTGGFGTSIAPEATGPMLDQFVAGGGNFIDTAHNYGDWASDVPRSYSERLIGQWLRQTNARGQLIIATKGGHPKFDAPEVGRLGPSDLADDIDGSLEALEIDQIDLYWLHADEPTRPVEEVLETLWGHQDQGKLRYLGASNWVPSRIRAANAYADSQGRAGFVADQVLWNAAVLATKPYGSDGTGWMNAERFAMHQETEMACVPYQSQAFGLFHRMHSGTLDQMNRGFRGFYRPEECAQRYERMRVIMSQAGLTVTQVVLGYLTSQAFVTVPIIGPQTSQQLSDSLTALEVKLTPDQVRFIDRGQPGSELP